MNKKLIAVTVAGALVAPAAFAAGDPEVYGTLHLSVGQFDDEADDATVKAGGGDGSFMDMESNNSNLGVRGSEDLGGGLKGVYQIELSIDADDAAAPTMRDTFVGLAGDWGWLALGRHNSPYKNATGNYDVAPDTVIDYNGIMGIDPAGRKHDDRRNNAIMYKTNDINGFKLEALFGVGDNAKDTNADEQQEFDIMAKYGQGPWEVVAGYSTHMAQGANKATLGKEDAEAMKLGGKFGFNNGNTWVAAVWETADGGGNNNDRDAYYVSGQHTFGSNAIGVGYAAADDVGNTNDSGAQLIQVHLSHMMSKRTSGYVQYGALSYDKNTTADYGLVYGGFQPYAADKTASWFGLGVIHKFSSM